MKTYLYLQFKRTMRFFPFVAAVAIILFSGLMLVFNGILKLNDESSDSQRFRIGIVGDTEDTYLELAVTALETFDSSRFAIEFTEMDEPTAVSAIEKGSVSAYVVIPDDFIESALRGEIKSIKYVTTPGSIGLVSILKDEITKVISDVLSESQKGVYGLSDALRNNSHGRLAYKHMNKFYVDYIDFVLDRSGMYRVEELGIADGLSLPQYFFCGITVLFLLLLGIPYALLFVKKDLSLNKTLMSYGKSSSKQVLCEYLAYFFAMTLLVLAVLTIAAAAVSIFNTDLFNTHIIVSLAVRAIPVIAMLSAFSLLLFELSENLVSGILLQFFSALALCYVSGCLYPIYTFPLAIQRLSAFLPTGIARAHLAGGFTEQLSPFNTMGIVIYSAVFLFSAIMVRRHKITERRV